MLRKGLGQSASHPASFLPDAMNRENILKGNVLARDDDFFFDPFSTLRFFNALVPHQKGGYQAPVGLSNEFARN